MNHPSCIKIPGGPKECTLNPNSSTRDTTDIRDQLCTRNDLISLANEVFGSDKWSHAVTSQTLDFVEYITGKYYVGCAAFVKVQLKDGIFHEDLGYSNADCPNKGLAIFSARTSSITNALKNTLLCFGGEIETKIKNFIKLKTAEPSSMISTIGEPQRFPVPKVPKVPSPQAASTPKKGDAQLSTIAPAAVLEDNNKQAPLPVNVIEKKLTSPYPKPVEKNVQVDKAAMTEEERRIERKRRQAQKQEEYRKKLLKEMDSEKPNPRY